MYKLKQSRMLDTVISGVIVLASIGLILYGLAEPYISR